MNNTTPEGFRTAAYLAAKARLDARKTTRNVQCNPPNVRCGNRCIPPSWDCRLKGQGTDPHLRATQTDPLGGLANIQRGASRIARGIVRGNFSEVEGGKRAIIRGTVKATPGNLQQKKELQKKLEDRTRAIGIGLAVVTGGLGIHSILMKSNTFGYREGVGANINNSVRLGLSRVLDATPIIGANRARVRAQVQSGIEAQLQRQANPVESVLTGQLTRTTPAQADTDARSKLVVALQAVNDSHRGATSSFDAWNKEHQQVFFNTTKHESGVGLGVKEEGNVFARPATDEFLARQFNLQGDDTLTSKSIKDAVQRQLTDYKSSLLDLAQQQGFSITNTRNGRVIAEKDQRAFIQGVVNSTLPKGQGSLAVRGVLTKHLEDTLSLSPKGRTDALYRSTYKGFDEFYKSQGSVISNVTQSGRMTKALRETGAEETMLNGTMARSQYLLGLTRPGQRVQGPAHAELVLRDYHSEVTGTGPRRMYAVTDRLAVAAASELEGRTVNKGEAFQILEREGFTRAVPAKTAVTARTRPMSEGEAVYALMRENPGMTLQAARREVKRRRGDEDDFSPELVRTATYLAARADFKESSRLGKPCGASHIPKAHECQKGRGAAASENDQKRKAATVAAVAGGAVALAVAGTVAYNLKTLSDPTKSPLTPSPGIKDLVKSMKQEASTKSASEAMGYYYTKKSGLKPGDVVYFRNEKDPAAHFGIYLGEGKDGIVRAVIANTNKSRFSWTDVAEIGATKPGLKTSQALMTPLIKAPDPKFKARTGAPFTNEEVVKRAIRIAGTDYRFSLTRDNCEALANGIAYGVPESEQLQRFRRATRAVVDLGVSRGQRREGREAIYQGRAQGRNYTATEFVTFLQGQREFSSPAGKDLAKQYAQYFEGSRLDAERAGGGLISPDELWSRIKTYGPAMRAQAMADYLLIQRSLVEMDRGRS
jgi:signal peptidase I